MATTHTRTGTIREILDAEIQTLLRDLGSGKVDGVAYDTAWVARLAPRYPGYGFERSLDWLRQNQYEDGTWGAPLVHYHDRFISTLAAIVALREVGADKRDERRVKRGEQALWHLVGKLGRDDSDTIGFPILSAALAEEASELGLDVPRAPVRYKERFAKKVATLLEQSQRNWRGSTLLVNLESLREELHGGDVVLSLNGTVGASPAATAGFLLRFENKDSLDALRRVQQKGNTAGSSPPFEVFDLFELIWSLHRLRMSNVIDLSDAVVQEKISYLWENWSPEFGISHSTSFPLTDIDDTALGFSLLHWAGYPVDETVFEHYEQDTHFRCFPYESNPSPSVHLNLLTALKITGIAQKRPAWVQKSVTALRRYDENGSYWWDKWHTSPYYVVNAAMYALPDIADDLVCSRIKWIMRTQNDDGGWGFSDKSTIEETAYGLDSLLLWEKFGGSVDDSQILRAYRFLLGNLDAMQYTPLWIHKGLYTPRLIVRSTILGTLYKCARQKQWETMSQLP